MCFHVRIATVLTNHSIAKITNKMVAVVFMSIPTSKYYYV